MWPRLVPGKRYFATSLMKPKLGSFVVFRDVSKNEVMVKQVVEVRDDAYVASGTVPWSSTHVVPRSAVIGTLLLHRR